MNPFLQQVAGFLYRKHGESLNRLSVVFPSRRSGVFFNAYLNDLVERPALGPGVITINELVSQLSGLGIVMDEGGMRGRRDLFRLSHFG